MQAKLLAQCTIEVEQWQIRQPRPLLLPCNQVLECINDDRLIGQPEDKVWWPYTAASMLGQLIYLNKVTQQHPAGPEMTVQDVSAKGGVMRNACTSLRARHICAVLQNHQPT